MIAVLQFSHLKCTLSPAIGKSQRISEQVELVSPKPGSWIGGNTGYELSKGKFFRVGVESGLVLFSQGFYDTIRSKVKFEDVCSGFRTTEQ